MVANSYFVKKADTRLHNQSEPSLAHPREYQQWFITLVPEYEVRSHLKAAVCMY